MSPTRIGIVVNEISGDQLATSLIRALKRKRPELQFEGMTGPLMEAEGCAGLEKIDPVMGLTEVIRHLPHLLGVRRRLFHHFSKRPPALFIGVDAPDFNLSLERRLKAQGIKTAHFVSPTVWAWRQGRAKKFSSTVDLMLCIFDFEVEFLRRYRVNAAYVGHPMADEIPLEPIPAAAQRRQLGMDPRRPAIAILPGSRMSEVSRLSDAFINTARWCLERRPQLQFVVPLVNAGVREFFGQHLAELAPELPVTLLDQQARQAILAAEAVLVASGTATLECLLLKRPMVVGYRVSPLTYWLFKRFQLLKVDHVALSNLLCDQPLAPEFLQQACNPQKLGPALLELMDSEGKRASIAEAYRRVHESMRCNAAERAAEQLLALLEDGASPGL